MTFVRMGDDIYMQLMKDPLLDKMGTIPVDGPQDFEKIGEKMKKMRSEDQRSSI